MLQNRTATHTMTTTGWRTKKRSGIPLSGRCVLAIFLLAVHTTTSIGLLLQPCNAFHHVVRLIPSSPHDGATAERCGKKGCNGPRLDCQCSRRRRRPRGMHLTAKFDDSDEYTRLARRMARLEGIVDDQRKEIDELQSSMDEMQAIIHIQAQIDAFLVDDGDKGGQGLLAARLEAGGHGREQDQILVEQIIRLLRMRQRILTAWDFRDFNGDNEEQSGEDLASEFSAMKEAMGLTAPPALPPPSDRDRPRFTQRCFGDGYRYNGGVMGHVEEHGVDGQWDREQEGEQEEGLGFGGRLKIRPPKTNQDAADAAGAGVVAALMEGRRRLMVDVDDTQLRYNSPHFCCDAMAEFVELLVLPLTTALENLNAEQNRCKIVIQGTQHVADAKEAMVLDAPDSLQVVSLEEAKVEKQDRVVANVAPENWSGKRGKHLKRVLAEAHDSAIVLINPTDPDKFLRPADFNTFELVYHLRPMRVSYLQPLPPPSQRQFRRQTEHDTTGGSDQTASGAQVGTGGGQEHRHPPFSGEALLLESLGESILVEEQALAAGAGAAEAAMEASAVASAEVPAAVTKAEFEAEEARREKRKLRKKDLVKASNRRNSKASKDDVKNMDSRGKKWSSRSGSPRGRAGTACANDEGAAANEAQDDEKQRQQSSEMEIPRSESQQKSIEHPSRLYSPSNTGAFTMPTAAAAAAEMGIRRAERAATRASLDMDLGKDCEKNSIDLDVPRDGGRRFAGGKDVEDRISEDNAAAALAAWGFGGGGLEGENRGVGAEQRGWGESEWRDRDWDDEDEVGDEAAEMSALAVTLRQYPDAWEAFVDLHDGEGFRLCGSWELAPPASAVRTVVMDHILRLVMD